MRWRTDGDKPVDGQNRVIRTFAILPITILTGNGFETRWLENVKILQEYDGECYARCEEERWKNIKFID